LFILALKRYHEQVVEQNLKVLRHTRPAIKGLRKFFEEKIRQALAPDEVRGCLMTNSAAEVTLLDRGMAQCVSDSLRAMEQAFFEAVKRAQQEGLVSRRKHPRALARFLLNSTQGLLVVSKTRSDAALLRDIVKTTLATLH
jgi:TetR/AcrR family transcriptional repressor of nem operon